MKRAIILITLLLVLFAAKPAAAADTQLLVQANLSAPAMNLVCLLNACQVTQVINGSPNNFFVLSASSWVNSGFLASVLQSIPGVVDVAVTGGQNPVGNRYIVRTTGGLLNLRALCLLNLCQILEPLDGTENQL